MYTKTFALAATLALANAAPILPRDSSSGITITADMLTTIGPKSASCADADYPTECATASTAAPHINTSFTKYGLTTLGQQAAALALMLFESDYFHYNTHHFPSPNPGQGTRNMQSLTYNTAYATSLYGASAVASASASGDGDDVLKLVLGDDASFGSAAWFMSTQCSDSVKSGLVFGDATGWANYLSGCVGTTDTSDRDVVWQKVNQVLQSAGAGTTTTQTETETSGEACPA